MAITLSSEGSPQSQLRSPQVWGRRQLPGHSQAQLTLNWRQRNPSAHLHGGCLPSQRARNACMEYTQTYTHIHMHIHKFNHIKIHTHIDTLTYTYIHLLICIHTFSKIYTHNTHNTHIHTYIYTHIHICSQTQNTRAHSFIHTHKYAHSYMQTHIHATMLTYRSSQRVEGKVLLTGNPLVQHYVGRN